MNNDFVSAMLNWNRSKEKYISENMPEVKKALAPRKDIFIRIPTQFEEEIKEFVKSKRKEADENFSGSSERMRLELSLTFEEFNKPPKSSDY